jgi:hypothetical protein
MRTRRRNWILKRIVLGFAVAALVAPAAAQARVDEGISGQPNAASESSGVKSGVKSGGYIPFVTDFPSYANQSVTTGTPSGLPRAGLNDYLQARDGIEIARLNPRSTLRANDLIEKVRVAPQVSTPQAVASPGFDWSDAGIGAGLALGLVLLGAAAVRASRHLGKAQTA